MPELNEYEYLETAPEYLAPIVNLIEWAANENWPSTYALFLDITGLSEDMSLGPLTVDCEIYRGFLECSYLAAALELWSTRPRDVRDFVEEYERLAMENA